MCVGGEEGAEAYIGKHEYNGKGPVVLLQGHFVEVEF